MPKSAQTYASSQHDFNQMDFMIRRTLVDVHTSLPCRVLECYPLPPGDAKANDEGIMGLVDVELMIDQIDNKREKINTHPIYNVPYGRLQVGNCAIVMDPVKGDKGWLQFAERDISIYKNTGEKSLPATDRMLSQSDCWYFPGVMNKPPEIYIQIHPEKGVVINCGGKGFKLENCSGIEMETDGSTKVTCKEDIIKQCKNQKTTCEKNCSTKCETNSLDCQKSTCSGSMSCGEMSCSSMDCAGDSKCGGNSSCSGNSSCDGVTQCKGGMTCGDGLQAQPGVFTAAKDFIIQGIGKVSDLFGGGGGS